MRSSRYSPLTWLALVALAASSTGQEESVDLDRLRFMENHGQWPDDAAFVARLPNTDVWLQRSGWTTVVPLNQGGAKWAARVSWGGESCSSRPIGEGQQKARFHFFLGRERHLNVPAYDRVCYSNAFNGIDIVFRSGRCGGSGLAFDLLFEPGAIAEEAVLTCEGVDALEIDECGRLALHTPAGPLVYDRPIAWQCKANGTTELVECEFRLVGDDAFGFSTRGRDPLLAMVIDPELRYSTFLGGSAEDEIHDIQASGSPGWGVVVAGSTASLDFPTTPGAFDPSPNGGTDGFITHLDPLGEQLRWSTYIGGAGSDRVTVAAGPHPGYFAGETDSPDFPTSSDAPQPTLGGGTDAFAIALDQTGSQLTFATFVGGAKDEQCTGAYSRLGLWVCGSTESEDFPTTTNAFDSSYNGGARDGFVVHYVHPDVGSATFLGGNGDDWITGLTATNPHGSGISVVGGTTSPYFPTSTGAFQKTRHGPQDAFATRFDMSLEHVTFSTYLGGAGAEEATSVRSHALFQTVVGGWTDSADYPTTPGAFSRVHAGERDAFVTVLPGALDTLVASTLFGGSGDDTLEAMSWSDSFVLGGATRSADFPTTPGCFDDTWNASATDAADGFVAALNVPLSTLQYSTFLGGEAEDRVQALAGSTAVGRTASRSFPTTRGAWKRTFGGGAAHGFLTQLRLVAGPIAYGVGKPNSSGRPSTLGWRGFPCSSDQDFELEIDSPGVANQVGIVLEGVDRATIRSKGERFCCSPPSSAARCSNWTAMA